jgi:hypothetical protein
MFSYEIRGIPLTFYPSYTEGEQNLETPNLQVIFKNSEPARFKELFKTWRENRFMYTMMYANPHYISRGFVNKPRHLTLTGKVSKIIDIEEEKVQRVEEL